MHSVGSGSSGSSVSASSMMTMKTTSEAALCALLAAKSADLLLPMRREKRRQQCTLGWNGRTTERVFDGRQRTRSECNRLTDGQTDGKEALPLLLMLVCARSLARLFRAPAQLGSIPASRRRARGHWRAGIAAHKCSVCCCVSVVTKERTDRGRAAREGRRKRNRFSC